MKSNLHKISEQEKLKILEMHYNGTNVLDEQKLFSGLKAGMRGFGQRLKTGIQGAAGSFKTQGATNVKQSAGLNRDVAIIKSRANDLLSTITPFEAELDKMIATLSNENHYGEGFKDTQLDFKDQLDSIKELINTFKKEITENIINFQPNYNKANEEIARQERNMKIQQNLIQQQQQDLNKQRQSLNQGTKPGGTSPLENIGF